MLDRSQQWVEADLKRLIQDKVQENIGLDYKVAAALGMQDSVKREVAKDVSAFANSGGGVLVYGMAEDGHIPTAIDPVDPNVFPKEWLENVVISNVQPRVDGLHINPVRLTDANAGRIAYVVTVPQSYTAHQAADYRYYKRFNFQSVPMEDYEIRDAMNRGKTPIIDLRFEPRLQRSDRDLHEYQLLVFLNNKGAVAARNIKLVMWIPSALQFEVLGLNRAPEYIDGAGSQQYRLLKISAQYSDTVLFPTDSTHLGERGVLIHFAIDQSRFEFVKKVDPEIKWTAYADDMAPRHGRVRIASLIQF